MTYDDVPYIKNLYAKMHTKGFAIQHNAYESKIGREVLSVSGKFEIIKNTGPEKNQNKNNVRKSFLSIIK